MKHQQAYNLVATLGCLKSIRSAWKEFFDLLKTRKQSGYTVYLRYAVLDLFLRLNVRCHVFILHSFFNSKRTVGLRKRPRHVAPRNPRANVLQTIQLSLPLALLLSSNIVQLSATLTFEFNAKTFIIRAKLQKTCDTSAIKQQPD